MKESPAPLAEAASATASPAPSAVAKAEDSAPAPFRAKGLKSGRPGAARRTRVFSLLQLPYDDALVRQRDIFERKIDGRHDADALFLLEHPHTITLGRSASRENVFLSPERAAELGVTITESDRGGDVTYHGPGQLVVYPIFDLRHWKQDIAAYVGGLEQVVIRALADFGITARSDDAGRGVWVGTRKIASIGVRVRRWVAMHGIALNVNTDLAAFRWINPCGFDAGIMTSMVEQGFDVSRQDEVRDRIIHHFGEIFGTRCELEAQLNIDHGSRPPWLKVRMPTGANFQRIQGLVDNQRLNTVCQSANCPNLGECWEHGTATFMINGNVCTRSCSFCAVFTGKPLTLDPHEPERVAESVAEMGLEHAVITAVNRDELRDGGAHQFARVIEGIRERAPGCTVEVLVPDFQGRRESIDAVVAARPDVFNHNVETVPRLYKVVRPQARYQQSLDVLKHAADAGLLAKSGMMVGLGEEREEVEQVIRDLHAHGVRILTIGQYMRPSDRHIPIARWVEPTEFDAYREFALSIGFAEAACAPLVRSSYHAKESFLLARRDQK